ncbi:MAG TPA: DUF2079 domain-containing protein [Acidimicrobiia bacterium]|nr:DUF2079 domain-containing protein [Acidimicrobiia bacterium]
MPSAPAAEARSEAAYSEPKVDWPDLFIWVALGLFFLVTTRDLLALHNNFWTFDYDLGIFDQAVWLLSRGEGFMTVRGLEVFGHHGSLAFYLLVPFYWLGAGPNFLNIVMVLAICFGGWVLFTYGRTLLGNAWWALLLSVAFLLHFTNSWQVRETFHPEVMAMAPFMAGYVAARDQRWRAFGIWMALAITWKEDVALAILVVGILLVIRGLRRPGWITIFSSLAYFVLVTRLLIPAFSDGVVFYENFYGDLGASPIDIARTALTDPTVVGGTLGEHDFFGYVRDLLAPFAFVPLLSPLTLLIAIPQVLANLLTVVDWTQNLRVHYAAMPLAAASLAMVEGVARLRRIGLQRFALGAVAAMSLATAVAWGTLPFGVEYDRGIWPIYGNDRRPLLEAAVGMPEPTASVTATYNLTPHLTHRRVIYTWPNPWRALHWGTGTEQPPDPSVIEWLVIDKTVLGDSVAEFESVIAEESWDVLMDESGVFVARRVP